MKTHLSQIYKEGHFSCILHKVKPTASPKSTPTIWCHHSLLSAPLLSDAHPFVVVGGAEVV